jgi:DNA segregation ATPase FtsK/SpoIIIE, S-DNA-T family
MTDTTNTHPGTIPDALADVHYLPGAHNVPTPAADEPLDAELVSEEEYERLTSQRAQAMARYEGYRRDLVTLARVLHTVVLWSGRNASSKGKPALLFARRHAMFVLKGIEAERQRKKAERHQADARAARARALEQNDLVQVAQLNQQIQQSRHVRVDTLIKWVELGWSAGKKLALALVILTGVALVLGVANGFGGWFGDWNAADVLNTLGAITATTWSIVAWSVLHAWLFLLAGLGVWGFRRWKDGKRLGENVLPEHLRRDANRSQYVELTESALAAALANIGNTKLNSSIKEGWPNRDTDHAWVQFPMIEAKGWSAKIRLPLGVPVAVVNKAKEAMAHNLGCRPQELFIEEDTEDPTVMDLLRLDPGVLREPVPDYPLLDEGTTDFWTGFPVGVSPRGDQVTGVTNERNIVTSGIMGSGKSTLIITLLTGAILDPLVDIDVFVFAENADYDALRPCLNTFSSGDTEENVDACLTHLEALREDLNKRGKLLQEYGVTSVTREVATKEPGLRPRIVIIDECQSFFRQDTPEKRRQVVNMMVRFFSAARKYGITCVFATPVPSDQSLPRDLVSVTTNRACFAIGDKTRNNVVLGDKAHENGISALGLKPKTKTALNDVGTAITVGFMDKPGALRCYHVTPEQQTRIVERALELRGGPTRRTEIAAPVEQRDLLVDLAAVLGDAPVKSADVPPLLRDHAPEWPPYRSLTGTELRAWLARDYKIIVPSTKNKWPVDPDTVREHILARGVAETDTED